VKARHILGPISHHFESSDALRDRWRWKAETDAGSD
jgi:hypothetical protein